MPEPDRSRPHPAAAPPDGNPAAVPGADPAAVPDASPAAVPGADPAAVLDAVLAAAPRADPAGGAGGTDAGAGAGAGARTARAVWRALGESGLLAGLYPAPDRTGRLGVRPRAGPLRDLLTALEERCSTGVALSVCVQVATALPVLSAALDSPVARRVYEAAVNGEAVVALAATAAARAGSDLINLGTRVDLAPDALTVHGGKRWITNACSADWLLVLGRHRPQPHFTSLVWALVPAAAPGVRATPAGDTMFAGAAVGHLSFDRVTLGRDHLAGTPGLGLAVFGRHVTTERLAGALWAGARTRRVLAATLDRLITRHLGDQPMWANPAIRERFSRCLMHWWRLDELTARFAGQLDEPTSLVSSMLLKATVAEAVDAILGECARLHGADAFVAQGLAHLRAESAMFGIAGGAADAMLAGVADSAGSLLAARGRPATGPTRPPDPPAAQPPAAQPATAARPGGWL